MGLPGHLATITSAEENQWIVDYLGGALTLDHWLVGFQDLNDEWQWVKGEPWSYTNWYPGEPNSLIERALQFDDDETDPPEIGFWNDLNHNAIEDGFIVEWDTPNPIPEPSTILLLDSGLIGLAGWSRRKLNKN